MMTRNVEILTMYRKANAEQVPVFSFVLKDTVTILIAPDRLLKKKEKKVELFWIIFLSSPQI